MPDSSFINIVGACERTMAPGSDSKACLTPRDVERRYPSFTRHELSRRRALGLPPRFEVVSGCVMYPHGEIESLLIGMEREIDPLPSVYARADTRVEVAAADKAANRLPLHLAVRFRDLQQKDAARAGGVAPHIRPLVPIVLALARIAAANDLDSQ